MKLKIVVPEKILIEQETNKIIAEGANGSFCLLPHHIDFLSILVPSILIFQDLDNQKQYLIHDAGIFIKQGPMVLISVKHALLDKSLGSLKTKLEEKFQNIENQEEKTKKLLAELEIDFIKKFLEIKK